MVLTTVKTDPFLTAPDLVIKIAGYENNRFPIFKVDNNG
jgi:hypothetical protein